MILKTFFLGQAIRLLRISSEDGGNLYGADLAQSVIERYGFLEGPKTVADFNMETGITFLHGNFNGSLIDKLQVYREGLLVEARLNTDYCDAFIDDIIFWAEESHKIEFIEKENAKRLYISTFDAKSDFELTQLFKPISFLAKELNETIKTYNIDQEPHEYFSFSLRKLMPQNSSVFSLEISLRSKPGENILYTTAPLRTKDHVYLIEKLENQFRTVTNA